MADDDPIVPTDGRLGAFLQMPEEEKLELAVALVRRDEHDRFLLGVERLREQYPAAPQKLLGAGAYNLYGHLATAFIEVLAHVELNLRDPENEISEAILFHPTYHLYSWLQIEALLPWAKSDFQDELEYLGEFLGDGDLEGAKQCLSKLMDRFEGSSQPPLPDKD